MSGNHCSIRAIFLLLLLAWLAPAWARVDVTPQAAAIASAHPLAGRAGYEILRQGGNAFDAAVAVSAVLAVVEPYSSGLGGGGFWLLHRAADRYEVMLDGREKAPLRATRDMYLDSSGRPIPGASLRGPKAAGIPGVPAALDRLARKYGRLPLSVSLKPAIRYAREGFAVGARYLGMAQSNEALLRENANAKRIFLQDGKAPESGFVLKQSQLAATLEALARRGGAGFYRGKVARELVASVQSSGGIWRMEDLARYRVVERKPLKLTYRNAVITTASLPSSGGLTLAQSLNILGELPFAQADPPQRAHLIVESWRRAYQDRARYLGDPDFVQVPVDMLSSKEYARARAADIDSLRATPGAQLDRADEKPEGRNTTHFSIVDREGNRVAATLSINTSFGSGFVAGTSGVLLNSEMDDFSVSPGVPNVYGLVGNEANAIEPGKRPLSSMSPTFVESDKGILIVGTPGGSRIISMVALAILDFVHSDPVDLERMVAAPRFHHQYLPDRVEIEPDAFPREWIEALEQKGHTVQAAKARWGNMQAVFVERATGRTFAAADPRGR